MSEPRYFGGLVQKHDPESVGSSGHHDGPEGRHYHCSVPGCEQEHATAAHAAAHAGEEVAGKTQPELKVAHRDLRSGQFAESTERAAVDMGGQSEIAHLDLTSGPGAAEIAPGFNRPLIVDGHESDSPQNTGRTSPVARP